MADDLLRLVLDHLSSKASYPIIVSGSVGSGKTSLCTTVAELLRGEGFKPGGVLSPRIVESGKTIGYDIIDLRTGDSRSFVRSNPPGKTVGRFFLKSGALDFANGAISESIGGCDPVFVDEVGRLELKNKGLAPSVRELLSSDSQPIFLVRSQFIPEVRQLFEIPEYDEFRADG